MKGRNLDADAWAYLPPDAEQLAIVAEARESLPAMRDEREGTAESLEPLADAVGDVSYLKHEAVCKVTGYTYNGHLPRSPYVNEKGERIA